MRPATPQGSRGPSPDAPRGPDISEGQQQRSIKRASERASVHRRVFFAGVRVVPIIMFERILLAGVVVFHCTSHDVTATVRFELANDCTWSSGLLEVTMLL